MENAIKLNIGCGADKRDGWVNIDSVKDFRPDIIHNLTNPLPFEDQTVDEILATGLLEHFDKYMRILVFYDWVRVLKMGGNIAITVPDFELTLKKFRKFGFDNFVDFIFGENMLCSETYIGHFGNHKFAYSKKSLTKFVQPFGIKELSNKSKSLNIEFLGTKTRHIQIEELDQMQIYSHANACGTGKAYLPLHFIKTRINQHHQDQD